MRRLPLKITLVLIWFFSVSPLQAASVTGIVVDDADGKPLSEANVTLRCSGMGTTTDPAGCFVLNGLICRKDTLVVSFMGYQTRILTIAFANQDTLECVIRLRSAVLPLPEITVAASRYRLERQLIDMDPSAVSFDSKRLRDMPMMGFADIYRALQKQQGITQTNEASPQLHIRGGNLDQNLVLLDGAPIYYPFHLLGLASSFNLDAIDGVVLSLGGFSTYFGNRLSSVLSLQTRHPRSALEATVNLQLIGADATLSGRNGRLGWLASVRSGFFDLVKTFGIDEVPYKLQDGLFKVEYHLSDQHHLQLTLFGNRDNLNDDETEKRELSSTSDTSQVSFDRILRDQICWQNRMISLQWDYRLNPSWRLHQTVFHSEYENDFQKEMLLQFPNKLDDRFLSEKQEQIQAAEQYNQEHRSNVDNHFYERGIRFSLEKHFSQGFCLIGGEYSTYRAHYSWDRLYSDLDEYRINLFFDYAPNGEFSTDRSFSHQAGFFECSLSIVDSLHIRPGVRLTRWNTAYPVVAEPRLAIGLNRLKWKVSLGMGRYTQGIATALHEGLVGFLDLYFPVYNQPGLEKADHLMLDGTWKISDNSQLQAACYYKSFDSLLRSEPESPPFQTCEGRSYGLELAFKGLWNSWLLSAHYTLSKSQRLFYRIWSDANFDQRHRLQLSAETRVNGFDMRFYWEFHTGQPYSPTIFYGYLPFFPFPLNGSGFGTVWYTPYEMAILKGTIRYPCYHRLDIQISRTFHRGQISITPYLSVYNAYARKNVLYFRESNFTYDIIDGHYQNPHLERKPFSLPVLPSLGIRMTWQTKHR